MKTSFLFFAQILFLKSMDITELEISGRCAKDWIAKSHEDIVVKPFHFKNGIYKLLKNQVKLILGRGRWSSNEDCPDETDSRNATEFISKFRFKNTDLIKVHIENLCSIDILILENLKFKINSKVIWSNRFFTRFDKHFDSQNELGKDTTLVKGGFFIYPDIPKVFINQTVFFCKTQTCSEL